jgi:two-component system OmpR family sensor kinase
MKRSWRDISLSWRLTALYVAILAAVLVTLGIVLFARVEHFLIDDTKARLETSAKAAIMRANRGNDPRRGPGGPFPQADTDRLKNLTMELTSQETVARAFSSDGTLLAIGPAIEDQPVPPECAVGDLQRAAAGETLPPQIDGNSRQLVVLMPLQVGGTTNGALQLTTSLAAADSLLAQLRLILVFGVLGAVALGAALGVPVTRTALRPLARVTATSERIAKGDLSQRTELTGGRDEIGRLATSFDRMVDRLEETLRAQRQFVADASHELRTPLTALGGLVEMLLLGADRGDTATVQRALRSAHREIERLSRLVGDLLTLSRLDAHPTLERRPLDLATLVAEVGEQTRFLANERIVSWQVDGALPMTGDRDRLKQVLLNLAGNAVAFTGETGQVELRAMRLGEQVRIEVADDGVGIDPAELPRLFERFYRGDKSRARRADGGGNGLGRAIARAIVEAHGGTIAARSALGQGTTFTIDLPLAAATPHSTLPRPTATAPKGLPNPEERQETVSGSA